MLTLLLCTAPAFAAEHEVGPAYTPEELAKVREWEKTWAGKRIDKNNIDQVADMLPQGFVDIYKNPQKWGAPEGEDFYAVIAPYKRCMETDGVRAATKKYSPLVKKNPDGSLANYADIAGVPFPSPKDGLEVMWNFDCNSHGDTNKYRRFSPNINPVSREDRLADQEQKEFYFIHRTELDPKPALPPEKNKKGIHRGIFLHMYLPPEFLNTRYYSLRYIEPKDDDTYMWYSQFRRIRRMSTKHRTDSIDGTDLIYDDEFFWDGHINRNTYKLVGTKEMLCARHQDMKQLARQSGQAIPNNISYERSKVLVIEAYSKDPNYLYKKRVLYIDPETFLALWTDIYDELGRYWKCNINFTNDIQTALGQTKNFIVGTSFQDIQRTHSGFNNQEYYYTPKVSIQLNPNMFTVAELQKTY